MNEHQHNAIFSIELKDCYKLKKVVFSCRVFINISQRIFLRSKNFVQVIEMKDDELWQKVAQKMDQGQPVPLVSYCWVTSHFYWKRAFRGMNNSLTLSWKKLVQSESKWKEKSNSIKISTPWFIRWLKSMYVLLEWKTDR